MQWAINEEPVQLEVPHEKKRTGAASTLFRWNVKSELEWNAHGNTAHGEMHVGTQQ